MAPHLQKQRRLVHSPPALPDDVFRTVLRTAEASDLAKLTCTSSEVAALAHTLGSERMHLLGLPVRNTCTSRLLRDLQAVERRLSLMLGLVQLLKGSALSKLEPRVANVVKHVRAPTAGMLDAVPIEEGRYLPKRTLPIRRLDGSINLRVVFRKLIAVLVDAQQPNLLPTLAPVLLAMQTDVREMGREVGHALQHEVSLLEGAHLTPFASFVARGLPQVWALQTFQKMQAPAIAPYVASILPALSDEASSTDYVRSAALRALDRMGGSLLAPHAADIRSVLEPLLEHPKGEVRAPARRIQQKLP